MKSESDRPITIEDLLRLKRAERPPAEFWTTFDRELRAKQLSALVAKRPWWQTMPKTFPRIFRYRIALSTTAVAALTLISMRTDRSSPTEAAPATVALDMSAPATVLSETPPTFVASVSGPEKSLLVVPPLVATTNVGAEVVPSSLTEVANKSLVTQRNATATEATEADAEPEARSPTSIVIAANPADIRGSDGDISRSLLVKNNAFELRSGSARTAVEPLQQMTPPGEFRRSRLLTAMVSTTSSEASYRTTERAASRIDEDRLYDQIHRFRASGDRVNVKF